MFGQFSFLKSLEFFFFPFYDLSTELHFQEKEIFLQKNCNKFGLRRKIKV